MDDLISLIVVILLIFVIIGIAISIYGLVLSFQAHLITGVIVLLIEPVPFIVGGIEIIWDYNLAEVFTDKFIK